MSQGVYEDGITARYMNPSVGMEIKRPPSKMVQVTEEYVARMEMIESMSEEQCEAYVNMVLAQEERSKPKPQVRTHFMFIPIPLFFNI